MKLLEGRFYRLIDKARAGEVLSPAQSPEGRFHHSGQRALYLSETIAGTHVAMARYKSTGPPGQIVLPLWLENARVLDLRDHSQCRRLNIDPSQTNSVWQEAPRPSPTWRISDVARALGADGMLYPSRSRPELTHVVLFEWNAPKGPVLGIKNVQNLAEQE